MADKNISPEKRLLNIIEGEGNDAETGKPLRANRARKLFSLSALKGKISFLKAHRLKEPIKIPKLAFNLGSFNLLMQLCIVVLVIYLGMSVKVEFSRLLKHNWDDNALQGPVISADVKAVASLLQSDSYYLNKVKSRNLFGFADEPKENKKVDFKETEKKNEPSELEKIAKNLKLVGISWSSDPDAIIEDEKAQKTYFVKTGHKINEIVVQAIYQDKVILHYKSQEVELR